MSEPKSTNCSRLTEVMGISHDSVNRLLLREFGEVKLFRTQLKDQLRHYVVFLPSTDSYASFRRQCVSHALG